VHGPRYAVAPSEHQREVGSGTTSRLGRVRSGARREESMTPETSCRVRRASSPRVDVKAFEAKRTQCGPRS
jgi:hypothetical protein